MQCAGCNEVFPQSGFRCPSCKLLFCRDCIAQHDDDSCEPEEDEDS